MNKRIQIMIISTLVLLLIGAGVYIYILNAKTQEEKEPTLDELLEASVDIPEITTNLLTDDFIRISFKLQSDSEDAKVEVEKRMFQINNMIIKQLSGMKAEDLSGTDGKLKLEEELKNQFNSILKDGKILQVYITSIIIQ
ncbi:flagellar basal body-associated protein FliL [Caldibacillus lycopersici]|uniref:Flagellar protein FliL n=1 Tax=Perspicuibacillus lycopersici TaxID=1325689 RepID=A0AAE3IRJ6_9BACI|nr:flagellar basal body-associated protein FliL [Perspicuibacillus lycopersici]MCU9612096.1 flagellar basal body-associated protein FliL [Perspicuibacillus lycopersici]